MTLDFHNPYRHGFVRAAVATPRVFPADPAANAAEILRLAREADALGAAFIVYPELTLSGYALDDLHLQTALLWAVQEALAEVAKASASFAASLIIGAPLLWRDALYNCALVVGQGVVHGVVPKTFLPNYREFYERRWFATGADLRSECILAGGQTAPFGLDQIFDIGGAKLAIDVCEDMWAPIPPSSYATMAGAQIIANLSASPITVGKARERAMLIAAQSARTACAYVFSASGPGESTTDLAWDGQSLIYELGALLAEGQRFPAAGDLIHADIDLDRIAFERRSTPTFRDCAAISPPPPYQTRSIAFAGAARAKSLARPVDRFPYLPDDPARLDQDCYEAYEIQVHGLKKRIEASHARTAIIGVSGGLDSTHALIVAAKTFQRLNRPMSDILAFTMPGFATGAGTKANAWALMTALGVTAAEIDIKPAAHQLLKDIGHPFARGEKVHDVTFENVQAGLRTDYLFRLANQHNGLVIGTGDLSELALGWCTYGVGDQMSHYGVNASVSKTLIQHLIRWAIRTSQYDGAVDLVLEKILATEISPELVPPGPDGKIQSTEDAIGPYALHDFALFHITRFGLAPSKIAFLAHAAWADAAKGAWPAFHPDTDKRSFELPVIKKWLAVFLKRFFETSQFKRSAMPNGPKVMSGGALSPRGDWRAPSDSCAKPWLEELARNVP
ncbi:MAG: NAD(+) synthase [Caulobacterales bacterium]